MSTWTTPAVLYAIVVCLGSILLYLGYRLLREDADRPWRWAIYGAVAPLLLDVRDSSSLYAAVCHLFSLAVPLAALPGYLLAAVAFFLFSLPWWMQTVAGLQVLFNPGQPASVPPLSFRLLAFLD